MSRFVSNQSTPVKEIVTVKDHDDFILNNKKCIMFFGSHKCPHCRDMVPVIEKMTRQYPGVKFSHAEVTKVVMNDFHENLNGHLTEGLPQFYAYRDGQPVARILGADPEGITNMINTYL